METGSDILFKKGYLNVIIILNVLILINVKIQIWSNQIQHAPFSTSFKTVVVLGSLQYHYYQSLIHFVQLQIENAARKGTRNEWKQQEEKERKSSHRKEENCKHLMPA